MVFIDTFIFSIVSLFVSHVVIGLLSGIMKRLSRRVEHAATKAALDLIHSILKTDEKMIRSFLHAYFRSMVFTEHEVQRELMEWLQGRFNHPQIESPTEIEDISTFTPLPFENTTDLLAN